MLCCSSFAGRAQIVKLLHNGFVKQGLLQWYDNEELIQFLLIIIIIMIMDWGFLISANSSRVLLALSNE